MKSDKTADELVEKVRELEDQVKQKDKEALYLQSDLENLKKRSERERMELYRYGWEPTAFDLLQVVDNLERALSHAKSETDTNLVEGLKLTLKQLQEVLGKYGVKRLEAVGRPFDPHLHEATALAPSDQEKGTILEEEAPGYTLHEKLLRPARVVTSSGQKKSA